MTKCNCCGKKLEIDECWARITDESGGKIVEASLCYDCAWKITEKIGKYK